MKGVEIVTYSSSRILAATIILVTSSLWTFSETTSEPGCLWTNRSIYTYPTTKQAGLQFVYLYIRSRYLGIVIAGGLTPWNASKFFPNRPEPLLKLNVSFRFTSLPRTNDKIDNTLGVALSGSLCSGNRFGSSSVMANI